MDTENKKTSQPDQFEGQTESGMKLPKTLKPAKNEELKTVSHGVLHDAIRLLSYYVEKHGDVTIEPSWADMRSYYIERMGEFSGAAFLAGLGSARPNAVTTLLNLGEALHGRVAVVQGITETERKSLAANQSFRQFFDEQDENAK